METPEYVCHRAVCHPPSPTDPERSGWRSKRPGIGPVEEPEDGRLTPACEIPGFHSSADFVESGKAFGVPEDEVRGDIARFPDRRATVERMVAASRLSEEARTRYLAKFADRLRAIAQ